MKTVQTRFADVNEVNSHRHLGIRTVIQEAFLMGAVSGFHAGSANDLETLHWITQKLAAALADK